MSTRHQHAHRRAEIVVHHRQSIRFCTGIEKKLRYLDGIRRCLLPRALYAVGCHVMQQRCVVTARASYNLSEILPGGPAESSIERRTRRTAGVGKRSSFAYPIVDPRESSRQSPLVAP